VLRPASNLQNTDYFCHSSFSTTQVSGRYRGKRTENSLQQPATSPSAVSSGPNGSAESMTPEKRRKVFCPQSFGLLTPETINIVLVKELN
jgi:hypothetical protein